MSCWLGWAMSTWSASSTKRQVRWWCMSGHGIDRCVRVVAGLVWSKGTSPVRVVDLPVFGHRVQLVWHKRRWRCPAVGCGVVSFTEVGKEVAPVRSALTTPAGRCATMAAEQDCPHPNACLTCPDFQTTPTPASPAPTSRPPQRSSTSTAANTTRPNYSSPPTEADGQLQLADNHRQVHDNLSQLIAALEDIADTTP